MSDETENTDDGGGLGAPADVPPFDDAPDDRAFDGDLDASCAYLPHNDLGNARRFVKRFGADFLYVAEAGWYAWDARRWDGVDGQWRAQIAAQATVDAIRLESQKMRDKDRNGELWLLLRKLAHRSGASGAIASLQREAAPHLRHAPEDMDAHPRLVTLADGTLELGPQVTLREHRREDLLTRIAPHPFDDAQAPLFQAFLEKILPDEEVRAFLQRWFGYCLTGETSEQVMCFFFGTGSNGKSTLINAVAHALGDLHMTVPIASLLRDDRRRGSEATPDLARLPGARFVTASEPEVGSRLAESMIKQLTGGERMAVRHLNHGFFEFLPQFKLTVCCNNRPTIKGQDEGIWRRIVMVPFDRKVGRDDVAPVYAALAGEGAGILAWIIRGAEAWCAEGLDIPASVRVVTETYRIEYDSVGQFLEAWCLTGEDAGGSSIAASVLWEAWRLWCRDAGDAPGSRNLFGRMLSERGYHREKVGTYFYRGVRLSEDGEAAYQAAQQRRGERIDGDDDA